MDKKTREPACITRALIPRNRSAQMNLSFGMIFSIILIIVFLVFGFYAITKFLNMQQDVQIQTFSQNFQEDVNKMWKSSEGSQSVKYSLPTKISSVCFQNDEFENMKFTSKSIIAGKKIENIDIAKTIKDENPFCIQNVKGKISMNIVKNYGETLVTITR
ncbi:Uncharacterised protein [uncultured archaeon]|nr:Uncharacterised protein [uncultured archaeon]